MIFHRPAPGLARIAACGALLFSALHAQVLESAVDSAGLQPPDSVAAADTVRLNPASDSATETSLPAASAAETVVPPVDAGQPGRPFSLFDYSEVISFGLSLDYLYYNENVDLSDEIRNFTNHFGNAPLFSGAPKSTEYGFLVGLRGGGTFYSLENKLFLRPRVALLFGFGNTYDGSLQGQPLLGQKGDTVGLEYDPYKFTKNNFFLHAGCDMGYSFPYLNFPFVIYTGLDFKLWYRDLTESQDVLYYTTGIANSETYYWLGVPLGVLITRPVNSKLMLGLDVSATIMLTGGMSVTMTAADGSAANYPVVTLGNRTSLKVELFAQNKLNDRLAVKFAPYFMWYGFGKSNIETATGGSNTQTFFEPSSDSYLMGFILTWEVLWKRFY
jgi:hypothetical protein